MESNAKQESQDSVQIDYFALIRAYKIIREYAQLAPENMNEILKNKFEAWRDKDEHCVEKHIAEMIVLDEALRSFCFGDEINAKVGFELIPDEYHL